MTEEELARFKSYPESKLIEYISGDKPTSPYHIAAKYELDRRASVRDALIDRILSASAIVISIVALLLSYLLRR